MPVSFLFTSREFFEIKNSPGSFLFGIDKGNLPEKAGHKGAGSRLTNLCREGRGAGRLGRIAQDSRTA